MPKIKKPLLAGNFDSLSAKFPYLATPKIDGIRFLMVDGVALSRSFKPIRNKHIQSLLSKYLPNGIDGELTSGNTFQSSTSSIMTIKGEPDFKVWIFDYVDANEGTILPYYLRMLNFPTIKAPFNFEILTGTSINNMEELNKYEQMCLENNFEGAMIRDPFGTYKFGRSTASDNILLKIKRFSDDEALLIRIEEKMSNQNESHIDALGHTKRSSSIAGMVGANTTGTLIVRHKNGMEFGIGTGLDDKLRDEIYNNKEKYLNKVYVKYKFFAKGMKDLPRHPVFLGFRSVDDMS